MKKWEISSLQAGWLIAGTVALTGHALAVTLFMRAGGRDTWLAGILAMPFGALGLWSIAKLANIFPGKTIVEYLPKIFGYAGYPLAWIYPLFYLTTVVFTLRMTTDWLVDSILPETPSWVMSLLYMLVVLYCTWGGLDVLARVNQFILPLLTMLGLTVSFGTIGSKDYKLLLPMFEFGLGPVIAVTVMGLGDLGEMSVAAAFSAYVRPKDRPKLSKAFLYALIYEVITLTGPIAGSISTLGYRVARAMPYPTFQHWLMVSFARFFERTDLLVVHQWLAGAYVRTGLFLLMSSDGFTRLTGTRQHLKWIMTGLGLLAVLLGEVAFPNKPVFDAFIGYVYLPAAAILGIVLPPVFLVVAYLRGMHRQNKGWSPGA
ncbi:MAG TPA: endospore germination permease [Symbiobacteriaceae bacterium]|jgi:spore germination protein (amino acid permease)